jgi:hypothetical protein
MNYKQKYIKYKKKYIQLKNIKQIGGNDYELIDTDGNRIDLNTELGRNKVKAGINFIKTYIVFNPVLEYVKRLGPEKIVATFDSQFIKNTNIRSSENFKTEWNNLDELNKKYVTKIYFPKNIINQGINSEFDIFITNERNAVQPIIFYLVKYIEILGEASNKTKEELLIMFTKPQGVNNSNIDLIRIAFGDVFGNGDWGKKELETCEGKFIFIIYLDLLKKLENKDIPKHKINIFLKLLDNTIFCIDIYLFNSCNEIKQIMFNKYGITIEKLIYNGKELPDYTTLFDNNIDDNSNIDIIIKDNEKIDKLVLRDENG